MTRHWTAALFASAACLLAAAPASQAASLDRSAAAKKALAALDARQGDNPLTVFGLRRTVPAARGSPRPARPAPTALAAPACPRASRVRA